MSIFTILTAVIIKHVIVPNIPIAQNAVPTAACHSSPSESNPPEPSEIAEYASPK